MRTLISVCCLALIGLAGIVHAEAPKPLKVLLVTGGCCHEYAKQKDLLKAGLEARAHVVVEQAHSDDKSGIGQISDIEDQFHQFVFLYLLQEQVLYILNHC